MMNQMKANLTANVIAANNNGSNPLEAINTARAELIDLGFGKTTASNIMRVILASIRMDQLEAKGASDKEMAAVTEYMAGASAALSI
jgi:hypothetical protein